MRRIILRLIPLSIICSCETAHAYCFDETGTMYGIAHLLLRTISRGESIQHFCHTLHPQREQRLRSQADQFIMGAYPANDWSPLDALADPCTNVKVGAWVLAQCISNYGYTWPAVGCYNSRTLTKRDRYAARIARLMSREPVALQQPRQALTQVTITDRSQMESPWETIFGHDPR